MSIKNLFVPKWKHSRAEVRIASLDEIGNNPGLLAEIARTDSAPEVRAAAIRRIDDEETLSAIIVAEQDEATRKVAVDKRDSAYEKLIATSSDPRAIAAVFEKYGSEKMIAAYLCSRTVDTDLQNRLIGRIVSPELLCKIAAHGCSLKTGERIVESIDAQEHLERIAEKASNKKIRLLARKKIDTLYPDLAAEHQALTRRLEQIVDSMEMRVGLENAVQAEGVLEVARSVWSQYDPDRTHALAPRFAAAETLLLEQIANRKARAEVVQKLKSLADQAESAIQEPVDIALDTLRSLSEQWNGIDKTGLSGAGFESATRQFTSATDTIRKNSECEEEKQNTIRENGEALSACCDDLERLVRSDNVVDSRKYDAILARWRRISLLEHRTPQALTRFAGLQKECEEAITANAVRRKNDIDKEEELITQMATRMESAAQATVNRAGALSQEIAQLKRRWERHYPLARELKATLEQRFAMAHQRFMSTLFEFKDQDSWKQWAAEKAKTEICTEIEQFEIRLQQGEPLNGLVRKVEVFENRWRKIARHDGEPAGELDKRYQSTCARIFASGYARKSELLETLKETVGSDSGPDASNTVKQIQQQWNEIGYLPWELEKDITEAFQSTCNSFFERRREAHQNIVAELQKNNTIREEICKEAEAIAGSNDWKDAIASFAELQKKWDESWPAPMKQSRELWVLFNGHRERFFERYAAYKQTNAETKTALCEKAEHLLERVLHPDSAALSTESGTTGEDAASTPPAEVEYSRLYAQVIELQRAWKECGPAPKEQSETLWERFRPTCEKMIEMIKLEQGRNHALKEALVVEAEALAGSDDWAQTAERFVAIREQWRTIPPAARWDEQTLWLRLQAAGDAFFDRRRKYFDDKKALTQQQIEAREELCRELELLVRIAGKGHLLKTAKPASSAEALKMGMAMRDEIAVPGDTQKTAENIKQRAFRIMDKWEAAAPGGGKEFHLLEKRFYDMVDILRSR